MLDFSPSFPIRKGIADRNRTESATVAFTIIASFRGLAKEGDFLSDTKRIINRRNSVSARVVSRSIFYSGGHGGQGRGGLDPHGLPVDQRDPAHVQVKHHRRLFSVLN